MVEINLLPWRHSVYESRLKRKKLGLMMVSCFFIILCILVHIMLTVSIKKANSHSVDLKNQLSQLSEVDKDSALYANLIKIQSDHQRLHDFLKSIAHTGFYSINISKINYTDSQISIVGNARSVYDMMSWMSYFHVTSYKMETNNNTDVVKFILVV